MKLYRLQSTVQAAGDLFDLRDGQGRLFDYFILNQGGDESIRRSKPRAQAQSRIRLRDVEQSDYLDASIGVPLFSTKARDVLSAGLPDEMRFYECVVQCQGTEITFFLGKVARILPLLDKEKSTYRTMASGKQTLAKAAYRTDIEQEFAIARDVDYPARLLVTQRFVDLCRRESLRIDFVDAC